MNNQRYTTHNSRKISHELVSKKVNDLEVGDLIVNVVNNKVVFVGQVFRVPKAFNKYAFTSIYNDLKGERFFMKNPNETVFVLKVNK